MTGGMAACLHQGWLPALLAAVLLSRHSPATDTEPVTSQDAALLAEVPEDILCFSRSFEDLTCFWDEEEASAIHRFYYWYSRDAPTTCAVSTQRSGVSGMRHICVFPSQDVRLFTPLHVLVLDTTTNRTRHRRELSVDAVGESLPWHDPDAYTQLPLPLPTRRWQYLGLAAAAALGMPQHIPAGLIAPPVNISARWAGAAGQLRVSWQPPLADYPNFFLYEVCYHPMTPTVTPRGTAPGDLPARPTGRAHPPTARGAAASQGTGQGLVQADTWVVLRELQPGVRYHIQVRSKPDGTSMDGVWGPWSEVVVAETPHSSGDIGLHCSTPDLQCVRCVWSWDPAEHHSTHELFYRASPSGAGMREDTWQQCEDASTGTQGSHACTFQPTAGSPIAVLVNVTRLHEPPVLSYFKEPFWLHQAVLTEAPQHVQATASQGRFSLQWLPPLEALAEQLEYQVRYATDNSLEWKVLQVPRAARKEVLDLRPGARYRAQVRAQPGGPQYQGSWSAWSQPVVVDVAAEAGWVIPSVTVAPLIFTGVLLGLRCTFPSLYSSVKQRLWPPVPDLHRALGTFLHDSPKQGQPSAGPGRLRPSRSPRAAPSASPPPSPAQRLLQAAAGGRRAALPAGGAARTPRRARGPPAGARCQPPGAQHGHRQPLLPADGRLGAARRALGPFSPRDIKYRPTTPSPRSFTPVPPRPIPGSVRGALLVPRPSAGRTAARRGKPRPTLRLSQSQRGCAGSP